MTSLTSFKINAYHVRHGEMKPPPNFREYRGTYWICDSSMEFCYIFMCCISAAIPQVFWSSPALGLSQLKQAVLDLGGPSAERGAPLAYAICGVGPGSAVASARDPYQGALMWVTPRFPHRPVSGPLPTPWKGVSGMYLFTVKAYA